MLNLNHQSSGDRHTSKMALCVAANTISEITERLSSVPVFTTNSTLITKNIKHHLSTIKEVLVAANLELNDTTTRDWVRQVTDVATDLFDLLDHLHLHLPSHASLLHKITSPQRHRSLLKLQKLEKRLQEVAASATQVSLKNIERLTISEDAKEQQEVQIVGRTPEKNQIINTSLQEEKVKGDVVSVLAIVGIQGMGKTKLAKSVFEDKRVKSDFDLRIWIDDDFDADFVKERVIHESALIKKKNIRFFLVLDNLRDENLEEWRKLHHMLKETASTSGAIGVILVTSQSCIVAKTVHSKYTSHLRGLYKSDSWSLFKKIAGEGAGNSKTIKTLQEMVEMCRGVPLAIITMARLLRSCEEMTEVKDKFMQEMQLIYYNNLPSWRLKQCFAYSSFIFSTGFANHLCQVDAGTLIRFWMAEGFLGPISSSPSQPEPEDLGLDCIDELCRRSIFRSHRNECGTLTKCSMSDHLIRDLSASVAGHESWSTDNPIPVKEGLRRVSLNSGFDVSNGIPKALFETNERLSSILFPVAKDARVPFEVKLSMPACDAIFAVSKRLRVLSLPDLGMKALPGSVGRLGSLRYLNLSYNNMTKLPNSVGELRYLQTLMLSHCHELRELPNDVNHFASLRHLEMDECLHLRHMPPALRNLTWLRTLSHFVASNSGGLGDLTNLNNLRGQLEISHLERLKFEEPNQSGYDYLRKKKYLECLTLRWNHDEDDDEDGSIAKHCHCLTLRTNHNNKAHSDGHYTGNQCPEYDHISFEYLEPHPNLKELSIMGYEGDKFSNWLSSLENLVKLRLYNCSECEFLPPLDKLPKLKILHLQRLDSLKFITYQEDCCNETFFPSLKDLRIPNCPNLTTWWKGKTYGDGKPSSSFPSISTLHIKYCPRLECMPLYPTLDAELNLECFCGEPLQETLMASASDSGCSPPLSKLKKLTIASVKEHSLPPEKWLQTFTSLEHLCVKWLESLPEGIEHLTSLNKLEIKSCPQLKTLTKDICCLKSLESFVIYECHKLASLPHGMSNLKSLKELRITNCPLLSPRCQEKTGDDWPQIKHIKDIIVKFTSQYYE